MEGRPHQWLSSGAKVNVSAGEVLGYSGCPVFTLHQLANSTHTHTHRTYRKHQIPMVVGAGTRPPPHPSPLPTLKTAAFVMLGSQRLRSTHRRFMGLWSSVLVGAPMPFFLGFCGHRLAQPKYSQSASFDERRQFSGPQVERVRNTTRPAAVDVRRAVAQASRRLLFGCPCFRRRTALAGRFGSASHASSSCTGLFRHSASRVVEHVLRGEP